MTRAKIGALTVLAVATAMAGGLWLASTDEQPPLAATAPPVEVPSEPAPAALALFPLEPERAPVEEPVPAFQELREQWYKAQTLDEQVQCADALATLSTAESVDFLLQRIATIYDWKARNELAKSLRATSSPEALNAMLPALLSRFDRGSRVLAELCEAIGRLAQEDTVATLEAMHWQSCTQAGQGLKVIRAIAAIRNKPAERELMRLSARSDSEALVAAANAALEKLGRQPPERLTATR